ncbi:MAG: translation initiation factor IF-3 [Chloroflexota bacterium]|nr:translation initiation factor IF-3 [Chloroflexota bacterium]
MRAKYHINHQIRASHVRLIDADGAHVGVVPLSEALAIAHEHDLDVVEVSPNAEPPVVRVMDYGKFLYQQSKQEREARKAQKQIEVKEIRLRPKTTDHHRSFKVRDARRWLEEGKKVKVRIRFRGREVTYPEIAIEQLMGIAEELSDVAMIEQRPNREGRTMLMVLAPGKKK